MIIYLLLVEKTATNEISIRKFYTRRILRIFPLYYLILLIAYFQPQFPDSHNELLKYFLLGGNFSMIETNSWPDNMILTPLWSICIEEHFYLFIPIIFALLSTKQIPRFLFMVIMSSILFRWYEFEMGSREWMNFYCHTLSRIDTIAIGGLLGYYYFKNKFAFHLKARWIWAVIMGLIFLLCLLDLHDFNGIMAVTIKKYTVIFPLACLFILLVFNKKNGVVLNTIKQNKFFDYLGTISYGLYLYHMVVLAVLSEFSLWQAMPMLKISGTILLTILISAFSYEFFEKPILKIKNRYKLV